MPSIINLAPLTALRDLIRLQHAHNPEDGYIQLRIGRTAAGAIILAVDELLAVEKHPNLAAVGARGAVFNGPDIPSYPVPTDVAGQQWGPSHAATFLHGARWEHNRWRVAAGLRSAGYPAPGSEETPAGEDPAASRSEPIPEGVRYDITANNFYSSRTEDGDAPGTTRDGQGMGAEFFNRWRHRKHEFPARLDADAVTLYDAAGEAHTMSDPELIATCRAKWPNEGRGPDIPKDAFAGKVPPVPRGVRWCSRHEVFVDEDDGEMDSRFHDNWHPRRSEFPQVEYSTGKPPGKE